MVSLEAEEERGLSGEKRGFLGAKPALQMMGPLHSAEREYKNDSSQKPHSTGFRTSQNLIRSILQSIGYCAQEI